MKERLIALLKEHVIELMQLNKTLAAYSGTQVQRSDIKEMAHAAGKKWFDEIRPILAKTDTKSDLVQFFSDQFEQLIRIARTRATKNTYSEIVNEIIASVAMRSAAIEAECLARAKALR